MSFWECLAVLPWAGEVSLQAAAQLDKLEKPRPEGEGIRNASPLESHTPLLWHKQGNIFCLSGSL